MMKARFSLNRKEFLNLSGLSLAGMVLLGKTRPAQAENTSGFFGRVIDEYIDLYEGPSKTTRPLVRHWKDAVLPIHFATTGPDEADFNRVWYQMGEMGYAHSASIQPVQVQLNPVTDSIPKGGILAEVTVPFTDAHWSPGKRYPVAYRFYYQTTHWVTGIRYDAEGKAWYQVEDDLWTYDYYAPAEHIRLLSAEDVSPISPDVPLEAKRVEIDTAAQYMVAIEDETPVFAARIASGAVFRNGDYSTPLGKHLIYHKRPSRHMAAGNLAANGFDLPGVPWVTYFTESGVAFHGTYWHNNYGYPRSHGCINLTPTAARWVYRWTLPVVPFEQQREMGVLGTAVNVR